MTTQSPDNPVARKQDVVMKALGSEMLVYDLKSHEAHCLNETAARVWQYCDGTRSAGEIAKHLTADLKAPIDEGVVWYALAGLEKNRLLDAWTVPAKRRISRRQALRTLGVSAIAVPLIATMSAPTPAQAASCVPVGQSCGLMSTCCPGLVCCPNSFTCQEECVT